MALDKMSDADHETDLADVLLPGTSLFHGQYRIQGFLGSGGFGITYLASDRLDRTVVLKECFVPAFCGRVQTSVRPRSETSKGHFQKVLRSFLNEAQILAALSHQNVVRVHQVFEDNGTAYMAIDYINGHDLLDIIDEKKVILTPASVVEMTRKLVSALGHVHAQDLLHCDISPDNICLRSDSDPVLIDFGSARKMALGVGQKHTGFSMVKDGYSPHELYTANGTCGAWSDVYSLGAALYHAITGIAPVDSQTRLSAVIEGLPDPLAPLAGSVKGYPPGFLASIDKAMSVQRYARHQSAQDWLVALTPPQTAAVRQVSPIRRVVVVSNALRLMENRAQSA